MRGKEPARRYKTEKLDFTGFWINWYWMAAVYWRSQLDFASHIHFNGRCPRTGYYYITYKEFAHYITITFISAGIFGIGIGQLFAEIFK